MDGSARRSRRDGRSERARGSALGLDYTGDPLPCRPWTLLGFPCLALPLAWTSERLPVGVQLVGSIEEDATLLRAGRWLSEPA